VLNSFHMSSPGRHALTRCVLWRPPHIQIPQDLLASLQRRNIAITDCTDGFAATAHLCRLQHTGRDPFVLLLVSPGHLPEAAEVLEVAARCAPHAARWWYDARSNPRLRQVTEEDIAAWAPAPPPSIASAFTAVEPLGPRRPAPAPSSSGGGPPALRLTRDGNGTKAPAAEPKAGPARNGSGPHLSGPAADESENPPRPPSTLLTNEELAMLLSDDIPTPRPARGPRGGLNGGAGGGAGGGGSSR
jgi:hypothetical protein